LKRIQVVFAVKCRIREEIIHKPQKESEAPQPQNQPAMRRGGANSVIKGLAKVGCEKLCRSNCEAFSSAVQGAQDTAAHNPE
jgi:hypothetical protein